MLGFIIAFWATPTMTSGHLVFATITTVWILISIQVEERDLIKFHGDDYQTYRKETGMLLPFRKKNSGCLIVPDDHCFARFNAFVRATVTVQG